MISSIFISKNIKDVFQLNSYCEINNYNLSAHSMISFSSLPFEFDFIFDVVYFSSPRAVDFYLKKMPVTSIIGKKIACSGLRTSDRIKSNGINVDFVLKNPGNVSDSTAVFQDWLGDKKVLFPCSTISLKTVLTGLPKGQFKVVEVYETLNKSRLIDLHDIYVFTSPSNVESFLLKNKINKNSKLISWGDSTSNYLKNNGHESDYVLENSSIIELINLLEKINV
ncbi:MAG: uroporphyrinogen-III synthase [Crocinitomicaceae bacterium]|nr:uroporphyrinogen-III synthase [Crocinitomicaceae bacterium]